MTPEERYAALVKFFLTQPGVTRQGKGFGSEALRVGGSIFALYSSRGEFVVKLPGARVQELIKSGDGHQFDPGHGRLMKEWLAMRRDSRKNWKALATEAKAFVASKSK